ncbi:MAG: lamin tail domain-containing protein [Caldilineales bacterium]
MERLMATRAAGTLSITTLNHQGKDEVVTIRNNGLAQEMSGWRLFSGQGEQSYHFPAGFVLMPDAEVRIHSGPEAKSEGLSDQLWTNHYIWRNEGDSASLSDADGNVVSTFSYEGAKS